MVAKIVSSFPLRIFLIKFFSLFDLRFKIPRSEFPQRGSKYYTPTLVKKSASIGANATIVCGNTIGEYSMVGSGAVVTKDVKPFSLVVGNPARLVYLIDKKGKKLLFDKNGISKCKNYALKNDKVEYLSK